MFSAFSAKVLTLALTAAVIATPPALASPLDECSEDTPNVFQIVSVYRANRPTHFHWAADRLSDTPGGFEPDAFTPAVAVKVSVANFGDQDDVVTIWLDPSALTLEQIRALDQPSMRIRRAAFSVVAQTVQRSVLRVDDQRSSLCDSDNVRCDDEIVTAPVIVTDMLPVVGPTN